MRQPVGQRRHPHHAPHQQQLRPVEHRAGRRDRQRDMTSRTVHSPNPRISSCTGRAPSAPVAHQNASTAPGSEQRRQHRRLDRHQPPMPVAPGRPNHCGPQRPRDPRIRRRSRAAGPHLSARIPGRHLEQRRIERTVVHRFGAQQRPPIGAGAQQHAIVGQAEPRRPHPPRPSCPSRCMPAPATVSAPCRTAAAAAPSGIPVALSGAAISITVRSANSHRAHASRGKVDNYVQARRSEDRCAAAARRRPNAAARAPWSRPPASSA